MLEAIYFDGKSSKPIPSTVTLIDNGFSISDGENRIIWDASLVQIETLSSKDQLLLTYGEWPQQRLKIKGDQVDEVRQHLNSGLIGQSYQKVSKINPIPLVLISLAILATVIYLYVYHISPAVADRAVVLIPKNVEQSLGDQTTNTTFRFTDIDSSKSVLLNKFYQECGFESEYDIRMHYSNEGIVNAFAVPGGGIFIYEGLVKKMDSWEELAALMSHELAHVNQRHSMKQLARSVSSYLIISVLTGDVAGLTGLILENAQSLHQMSNSRVMESEADEYGLKYLNAQQINPQGIIDLFNTLLDESKGMEDDLSKFRFLLSHPLTSDRIAAINKQIEKNPPTSDYRESEKLEELWDQIRGSDSENCEEMTAQDILEELKEDLKEVLFESDDEEN